MQRICVIDNSTLVNLTRLRHLQIFKYLRILFRAIYVPAKTLEEYQKMLPFEPERKWVVDQVQLAGHNFLIFCNRYDSIALAFLKTTKGIDPGEAEAAAQHKTLDSQFVLSDDLNFINAIRSTDKYIRVLGTLHLIALLDFNKIILNPSDYLKSLYEHSPFTSSKLRTAYQETAKELGINISKKELNEKTSLKSLGLK